MRRPKQDVGYYMLLKNNKVVYVGISRNPEARLNAHWRKGWDFDDIIENGEGPYTLSVALYLEKGLIAKHRPRYNVMHNGTVSASRTGARRKHTFNPGLYSSRGREAAAQ